MTKKIVSIFDMLLYIAISIPFLTISISIFLFGRLNDYVWILSHWYLVLLFAVGIIIPIVGFPLIRYVTIDDGEVVYFYYASFTTSWEKIANSIDEKWNQRFFISEISSVEIVKLTKDEKKRLVYLKHLRNKYLKINLKYGSPKYIFIGNYSNLQIQRMIKLFVAK